MSPEEIRERVQKLRTRGRLTNALLAVVFGFIGVYYGLQSAEADDLLSMVAYAFISAGNLYWTYLAVVASASSRPGAMAADAPLRTSLQLYAQILEQVLERVRGGNRRAWRGAIAILVGFGILIMRPAKQLAQYGTAEGALKAFVQNLGLPEWLIPWLPFVLIIASWAALRAYAKILSTKWIKREIERVNQMK